MTPCNDLPHGRAKDQSLEEARAPEVIAAVQSRPRRLAHCVQVAISPHAPLAAPNVFTIHGQDTSVEVGCQAAAGVVRHGRDGYGILHLSPTTMYVTPGARVHRGNNQRATTDRDV